jgi:hypothetical protein
MGALRAVVGALVAGTIGSVAWAFLLLEMNTEYGVLAWAVGGLVGLGALLGSGRKIRPMNGVIAALVAVLSVFGGKYYAVHDGFTNYSDELSKSYLADTVAERFMDEGRDFTWPAAGEDGNRTSVAHYPREIWSKAEIRWSQMGEEDQANFKQALRAQAIDRAGNTELEMTTQEIKDGLAFGDITFIILAIVSAFLIGSGMIGGEE